MECQNTQRKMIPSLPTWLVADVATQMDCASTILPITPPAELAAHIRTESSLSCSDVMRCRLPNRAFEDVSLPVRATPSHPRNVPKNGNSHPVRVNAKPSTASSPEYRVVNPTARRNAIAIRAVFLPWTVRHV